VCENLEGTQEDVPDGMIVDENGNCVEPPPPPPPPDDVCVNLEGMQEDVPDGMVVDENGNCVEPPEVAELPPQCNLTTETGKDGFPVVDMNPANCQDTQLARGPWTPLDVGGGVCPDWFVYHTNQTGDWEIFRYGPLPDGRDGDPNLSQGVGWRTYDVMPTRSPDAEWVAFASTRDGNWEIYVGKADGSFQQRVTYTPDASDLDPVWSPDGQSIVYTSSRNGSWDLYMIDVSSGAETRLTDDLAHEINAFWSPDSAQILFQSNREGFWQIYRLDLATNEITLLSDGAGDDHDPQYSHDGTMITFRTYRFGDNSVIMLMNADGSDLRMVSDPAGGATAGVFSFDDLLIAYQSDLDGDNDIYIYELTTEITRLVTDNAIEDYAPTWWCNSPIIIFTSDITTDSNLFETPALPMDAPPVQVETQAQLTSEPEADQYPENVPTEEDASLEEALPAPAKNK
ncbi:MAG: PD40 domain-containing protein, partial [Anaerolineae bacterium]|nr:PD40 domain-containing protein [Anaerolineae bacterium]